MLSNFQRFWPILRKQGFHRTSYIRHQDGDCKIYEKDVGYRTIDVQVYSNSGHRVSHMTHHKSDYRRARCKTYPSDFYDEESLIAAIENEINKPDPFNEYLEDI